MTDTMKLWNAVSKTDPKHTKAVSFGRKFTSIDAQYQIREATRQFGPVGIGWGYDVEYHTIPLPDNQVIIQAHVTLWTGSRDNSYGPIMGCEPLLAFDKSGKLRLDDDAGKKALTDALTKCLSHLGFNADVFLGMFDDNKYVQRMAKEFGEKEAANAWTPELEEKLIGALNLLRTATDKASLDKYLKELMADYNAIKLVSSAKAQELNDEYAKMEAQFKGKEAA